jgi:hypothetical protein
MGDPRAGCVRPGLEMADPHARIVRPGLEMGDPHAGIVRPEPELADEGRGIGDLYFGITVTGGMSTISHVGVWLLWGLPLNDSVPLYVEG